MLHINSTINAFKMSIYFFIIFCVTSFTNVHAQEESRSISENITWGKRKSFVESKVSVPYKYLLGFKRGKNS